ncbi:SH3 domain-containing protein [Bosea sp. 117]|uniref:SH3 domain-containing protein n=1 Tax=Bosea sp. 117 TaxID=1125973 RepID=UPI0012DF57CF|nr:SH3 domain-containing protein [Bosea sp. 117]
MRWTIGAVGVVAAIGAMVPAAGAQELRRYKPVTISYDVKGADDPGLTALIEKLRGALAKKDATAIREAASPQLVVIAPAIGFPPAAAPKPEKLDDKLTGPERLDKAFARLSTSGEEPKRKELDGLILLGVGEALAKGTVSRSTLVRGAFCAPAEPRFDRAQVLAVAKAAGEVPDNLVILTEETTFLEKPDTAAASAGALKPGTVVPFIEGAVEGADRKRDWYAVALPSGKRGYAKNDKSMSFEATRLCFTRDGKGEDAAWTISTIVIPSLIEQ